MCTLSVISVLCFCFGTVLVLIIIGADESVTTYVGGGTFTTYVSTIAIADMNMFEGP